MDVKILDKVSKYCEVSQNVGGFTLLTCKIDDRTITETVETSDLLKEAKIDNISNFNSKYPDISKKIFEE